MRIPNQTRSWPRAALVVILMISGWQLGFAAEESAGDVRVRETLKSVRKATTKTELTNACHELLKIVDESLAEDNYATAGRAANAASDVAIKSGIKALVFTAKSRKDDLQLIAKEYKSLSSAFKKLESALDDPDANRKVGLFLSAFREDWKRGAQMLAKAGSPLLNKVSSGELTAPEVAEEQMLLAAAWKEASETQSPTVKFRMQKRAYYWNQLAYRSAEGAVKQKYADELGQLALRYLSDMEALDIGVGAWPFFNYGRTGRDGSFPIEVEGTAYQLGLGMHPANDGKPFSVKYKLNGQYKTLQTACGLNYTAKSLKGVVNFAVYGDGRLLWTSAPFKSPADFDFTAVNVKGVQVLELRTTCTQDYDAHAVWLDPYVAK